MHLPVLEVACALVQRKRHVTSKTEAAVGDIVMALQRPVGDQGTGVFDRLGAISKLNSLTQLPGNGGAGRAAKLRTASVQVSAAVQSCLIVLWRMLCLDPK